MLFALLSILIPPTAEEARATPVTELPGPVAIVRNAVADLGPLRAGAEGIHTFVIENVGDDQLKLFGFDASCGCTSVVSLPEAIAPGCKAEVSVAVRTRWLCGPFFKSIEIQTNDRSHPTILLELVGSVEPRFEVVPSSLSLGALNPDSGGSQQVSIRKLTDGDWQLVLRSSDLKDVQFELRPANDPGRYTLMAKALPQIRPGIHQGIVTMSTGIEEYPEIEIPFCTNVEGELRAVPERFSFLPNATSATVIVHYTGTKPAQSVIASPSVASVRCAVDCLEAGKRWLITLSVPPVGDREAMAESSVRIDLGDGGSAPLVIPVRMFRSK